MEMLRQAILQALEDKYNAQISEADATIKIYLEKPVGIGEHPQHIEEIDKLLQKIELDIKKVEIHDSLVKVFTSTNMLISDRVNYEVNLNRLVISFQDLRKLFKREIKSIDMRYSNGFAIK